MRLFIPTIGTKLRLTQDFSFALYNEHGNTHLIEVLGLDGVFNNLRRYANPRWLEQERESEMVLLPAGTILQVDRIYIRKGLKDFDSITFKVIDSPMKNLVSKKAGGSSRTLVSFWAKLKDVNNIEFELA